MPEAMQLLNSLPDSIKGCLLEAARLCGAQAGLAQKNLLNQWHMQVALFLLAIVHPLLSPGRPSLSCSEASGP